MSLSIEYKELLAASVWGHQWSAKQVEFCSDNTAVVEVLRSHTSRDSNVIVLLRHLSMLAAQHSFAFTARHVTGSSNVVADALSQFDFQRFRQLVPQASPTPIPVPPSPLAQLPMALCFLQTSIHCCIFVPIWWIGCTILPSVDLQNPNHIMLWAACCIGFFGLSSIPTFTRPFM